MPDDVDRRSAIADAAIAIISSRGIRALTHRAIDAELGLPGGSTSYYMRTRKALLAGVVARLAERTTADLRAARPPATDGTRPSETGLGIELDNWAHTAGRLLDRMIGERRADSLARYALTLELATDPDLHRLLTAGGPIRTMAEADLRRFGAADPATAAADLVSFADGLVFDRLAGARALAGPAPGTANSITELARAIRTFLRGVIGL